MRIIKWGLALSLLIALAVAGIWHLQSGERQVRDRSGPEQATPVTVVEARRGEVEVTVEAVGTLRAREQVAVTSQVSGVVRAIHFEEGERVEKGQILLELDTDQEQAELDEALAELEEARRQYERGLELREEGMIAQAELDELEAAYETAAAEVRTIRADIMDRRIEAPFAGRIGLRRVSPGALIEPGDEVATLSTVDPMDLVFDVPAQLLSGLRPGLPVVARVFEYRNFRGELRLIDNQIDPATQSITLEAELPNPEGILRPGLFVNVELMIETREDAVLVPEEALILEGQKQYVYRVRDDGTVSRTPVETGERRAGAVEIREGVTAGEKVVVGGLQKIAHGQPVRPQPAGED